jgi:hypothetical protein
VNAYKQYSLMSTGGMAHDMNEADHAADRIGFENQVGR